jgi:hypothetical protein
MIHAKDFRAHRERETTAYAPYFNPKADAEGGRGAGNARRPAPKSAPKSAQGLPQVRSYKQLTAAQTSMRTLALKLLTGVHIYQLKQIIHTGQAAGLFKTLKE